MRYTELTVSVAAPDAERASEVLREATGESAWIDQPFTQRDLESDAEPQDDATAHVHVYIRHAAEAAIDYARARLAAAGIAAGFASADVAEEDWAEAWKEHFHVERYGDRIVVVPSWRAYAALPGDVVLTLDPGMAFGTGQHETTRMCLEAIEQCVKVGDRVLDLGCGSGILSIAAALLGARSVLAMDTDADCVRITSDNARLNAVGEVVGAVHGSIDEAPGHDAGSFDVAVANIIARVIIDAAPHLVGAVRRGGRIIASGVIDERLKATLDALERAGAHIETVRAMGEWRCIEATRVRRRP
jgi:ribosomal protein L11 methyltransferase